MTHNRPPDGPDAAAAGHPAMEPSAAERRVADPGRWANHGPLAPIAVRSAAAATPPNPLQLGPLSKVYLIWLAGASCEGCTVATIGAVRPRVEQLLTGEIPGLPRVELVHACLSVESGEEWIHNLVMAERGELDAPYVITWEGSVTDELTSRDGFWSGLGSDPDGEQTTSSDWLRRLAPGAAALIAVGTCAAWGGVPSGKGNATGAMGVGAYLGDDYRSAAGLPVVNVPGCAPIGDNYTETVAALLLALNQLAPLPEFDDLGRPAWLFGESVHSSCSRVSYYDDGVFASDLDSKECLVELGCWGPVVQCNITDRGVIDGHGGCMSMGGICIGCTMPGFPDQFGHVDQAALIARDLSRTSRVEGSFMRRLSTLPRPEIAPRKWSPHVAPARRTRRLAFHRRGSPPSRTPVAAGSYDARQFGAGRI